MMARPLQVVSVVLVYGLGLLVARAESGLSLTAGPALAGLIVLLLVAVSVHYANEYADYETDALTTPTPYSGGSGALPAGLIPRSVALWAAGGTLGVGLLGAWGLWLAGGLTGAALFLLHVGGFFGWMYSLPPLRLAWNGWGEVDNALLGGMILPLYGYSVVTGMITPAAVLVFLPFALLDFLNLLAVTWPDRQADSQVGKRTLATRWSPTALRGVYGLTAGGFLLSLFLLYDAILPPLVVGYSLAALPLVAVGAWTYTRRERPDAVVTAMTVLLLAQMLAWFQV